MTDLREAAQQALDAWDDPMKDLKDMCVAMDAIRTALEQQQAEPVSELQKRYLESEKAFQQQAEPVAKYKVTVIDDHHPAGVPLEQWGKKQAEPPHRKPLTDEQIIDAMHEDGCERIENFYVVGPVQKAAVFSFARAVEAKLKENT